MKSLHTHGKLLISAEYMVLYGSNCLALPLKLGQSLQLRRSVHYRVLSWNALYLDQSWFTAKLDPANLKILETNDPVKAEWLRNLIMACIELMPSFQEDLFKWDVETRLEFSPLWGLGSSSSVIALVAEWAEVNPLDLHFMVSEGSGYDVACAIAEGPISYRIRDNSWHYRHVPFHPPFSNQIYFAWLGIKQPTNEHLKRIAGSLQPDFKSIHRFSCLTEAMMEARDLVTFQNLMDEHETALSGLLGIDRISDSRFPGLPGSVKSLGAWGGDFVMIASQAKEKELFTYLNEMDIRVIYRYSDIVFYGNELQE